MMEYQHPGLPVTDLHLSHPLTAKVPDRGSFLALYLFVNKITQNLTDGF